MRRHISRREFLRLGGAGLAGAALLMGEARCSGSGSGENAIGWQAIPSYSLQATDQKRVDYLKNAVSNWEESNGPFTINPLVASSDVTVAMAKLLVQASQDREPDIAQVDSYTFPRFLEYAQPIDEYLEDAGMVEDYFPFARNLMVGSGGEVKGLQFTTDVRVMYYRNDLVPEPPASWDEMISLGQDLKQDITPYLFPAGRDEATSTTSLWPYFWAQGGELIDEEGNPVFGEGENVEKMRNCLQFIRDCVESGITPERVTTYRKEVDLNSEVKAGQVAMFLGGNWQVNTFKDILGADQFTSTWSVAPIPSMEGGDSHATTAGGWIWGVFAEATAKQRAGVKFLLDTFVNNEGMAGWCNAGGYLPPRENVFDVSEYKGNEYTDTFREHLDKYAHNRPSAEVYQNISIAMQVAVANVVTGEESPEQALDTAVVSVSLQRR
ncbi:MAG: extracellular solute-binding protein [Actinobacteria bacterium]|nr:extracellular solute-binding protein [Actinomycetota bacterium]